MCSQLQLRLDSLIAARGICYGREDSGSFRRLRPVSGLSVESTVDAGEVYLGGEGSYCALEVVADL